jgi:hypothetical protein
VSCGYQSLTWFLRSTDFGSPIIQDWCLTLFVRDDRFRESGFPTKPPAFGLPTRPMSNILLPFGAPRWSWKDPLQMIASPSTQPPLNPLNSVPIRVGSIPSVPSASPGSPSMLPVFIPAGPMPMLPSANVKLLRGLRQILPQERAMALGFPKSWD